MHFIYSNWKREGEKKKKKDKIPPPSPPPLSILQINNSIKNSNS